VQILLITEDLISAFRSLLKKRGVITIYFDMKRLYILEWHIHFTTVHSLINFNATVTSQLLAGTTTMQAS
jgi:hypothetical protein